MDKKKNHTQSLIHIRTHTCIQTYLHKQKTIYFTFTHTNTHTQRQKHTPT